MWRLKHSRLAHTYIYVQYNISQSMIALSTTLSKCLDSIRKYNASIFYTFLLSFLFAADAFGEF